MLSSPFACQHHVFTRNRFPVMSRVCSQQTRTHSKRSLRPNLNKRARADSRVAAATWLKHWIQRDRLVAKECARAATLPLHSCVCAPYPPASSVLPPPLALPKLRSWTIQLGPLASPEHRLSAVSPPWRSADRRQEPCLASPSACPRSPASRRTRRARHP
jgi:hypothetical protein